MENDLKQLHHTLITIAKAFHQLCTENGIPYYMQGGTMLGAIRHHGFIPWDDDMDFGIPREHYTRFIETAKEQLPEHLEVLTYQNSDYAVLGYAKISDNRTEITETYAPRTKEKLGINIDIFPLDHANGKKGLFSFNAYVRKSFKLQKLLMVEAKNRSLLKKMLAKTAQALIPISKNSIPQHLEKRLNGISDDDERPFLCNYFGAWGLKELIHRDIYGKPTLYHFEDMELYGAENYDAYLTQLYGDYMTPPPDKSRHGHQENND